MAYYTMNRNQLKDALRYFNSIGKTKVPLNSSNDVLMQHWTKLCDAEHLTIGIEIEFTLNTAPDDKQYIASQMQNSGLDVDAQMYNKVVHHKWKLIKDSTCGYELVSPILQGDKVFTELRKATNALQHIGAKVDEKCGLHIHIGIAHLALEDVKNIVLRWVQNEQHLDQIQPQSRRDNNNKYCQMSLFTVPMRYVKEATCILDIAEAQITRYTKLNMHSYQKHGTIEFRHHSGTINYDEIAHWIKFCKQFIVLSNEHTIEDKGFDHLFGTPELHQYYQYKKEQLAQ